MAAQKLKIHFIGLGGIGVSALARYYLGQGGQVSGSDLALSEITRDLKKKGAAVFSGPHKASNLKKDIDLVVYSPAVAKNNPELREAEKRGLKIQSYPQALGELTKRYFTIAVSGTHGKSTTTAMLGLLLAKAGLDPTVIVGTKVKEFGDSNCRLGKSKYLVIEADEHFASFLNYRPRIIILTTVEADHLDYYKNLANVVKSFKKYVGRLPKNGVLIANQDDKNIAKIKKGGFLLKEYSLKQPEAGLLKKILKVPGDHNIANALACLACARILGVSDKTSFDSLAGYQGSWRRFEIKRKANPTVVSDYGHHPTEIRVTLRAAREKWPEKKIWAVFQPHQYQRTYYLFKDFVKTFRQSPIDRMIITDIYDVAGREEKKIKDKISAEKLVKAIGKSNVVYLPKEKIAGFLKKEMPRSGVLIIMGAGDIYRLKAF